MSRTTWKWCGLVLWATALGVWGYRISNAGKPSFFVDGLSLTFRGEELLAHVASTDPVPTDWAWHRGTQLADESGQETNDGYIVELAPAPDQSLLAFPGFARIRLSNLFPTDTSAVGGDQPAPIQVQGAPGSELAMATPNGIILGERRGAKAVIEGVPAEQVEDSLLVSGTLNTYMLGSQPVHSLSSEADTDAGVEALPELLSVVEAELGPLPVGPTLIVQPPDEMNSVPTETFGSSLVLNWTPESSLSTLEICKQLLLRSMPEPDHAVDEWAVGALVTALAIESLGERGVTPAAELWEGLESEYVFLCASRDGALKDLKKGTPKTRRFLEFLKGPLLLRELVEERHQAGTPSRPSAVYGAALDSLASMPLADWAGENLTPAGCEQLELAVHRGGMIRRVADQALVLTEPENVDADPVFDLSIALTAGTENFLEACGCRAVQGAGLPRRMARMEAERQAFPAFMGLDLGNFAPRMTPDSVDHLTRSEVAFHLETMVSAGYEGFSLGVNEMFLGQSFVDQAIEAGDGRLGPLESDGEGWRATSHVRRFELEGQPVVLVSLPQVHPRWIMPEEYQRRSAWLDVSPPLELLTEAAANARELYESPDTLVVVYGTVAPWETAELVQQFPGIDLLVSGDKFVPATSDAAAGDPQKPQGAMRMGAQGFLDETLVVFSCMGEFGVAFLRMNLDGSRVGGYEIEGVKLRSTMPKDEGTVASLDEFYGGLEFPPLTTGPIFEEMALEQALFQGEGGYVGVDACKSCHMEEHNTWKVGPHGGAYKTLLKAHRERVPKCVQCHVTGMGLPTGFDLAQRSTEHLRNVQCEVCHGPGQAHAIDTPGDPEAIRRTVEIESCERCHDAEHSEPLRAKLSESWSIGAHRPRVPSSSSQE